MYRLGSNLGYAYQLSVNDVDDDGDFDVAVTMTHHWTSVLLNHRVSAADLDGDGCVGQGDLGILLADYGCESGDCPGDIDGDGQTGQSDLGVLLSHYGAGCK